MHNNQSVYVLLDPGRDPRGTAGQMDMEGYTVLIGSMLHVSRCQRVHHLAKHKDRHSFFAWPFLGPSWPSVYAGSSHRRTCPMTDGKTGKHRVNGEHPVRGPGHLSSGWWS